MNWYKTAKICNGFTKTASSWSENWIKEHKWPSDEEIAERNRLEDNARKEYLDTHPELSDKDKESIKAGHGSYIGSCGHRISGCRCSHGFSYRLPTKCEECK